LIDRDAIWVEDSDEPRKPLLDGVQIPHWDMEILKEEGAAHCKVLILKNSKV